MTETERRLKLAAELVADPAYAEGRRRYPRTVTVDDAVWLTGENHAALDARAVQRESLARARHRPIACAAGCNACCVQPVTVFLPEALRIAAWLRRDENAATRAHFLAAFPAWKEQAGDGFAPLLAAIARGDRAAEEEAHLAQWQRRAMCAFNRDGLCAIYPVRPAVCRTAHALDTAERCQPENYRGDRANLPTELRYEPVDQVFTTARLMSRAMHHALGGERATPKALCQAVHDLLTR